MKDKNKKQPVSLYLRMVSVDHVQYLEKEPGHGSELSGDNWEIIVDCLRNPQRYDLLDKTVYACDRLGLVVYVFGDKGDTDES